MNKVIVFTFLVLLMCFSTTIIKAQVIDINEFQPEYSYNGGEYKNIYGNIDELKVIMKDCPECINDLNSYEELIPPANVLGTIGGALIGWPIGGYIGSSLRGAAEWENTDTYMIVTGVLFATVALITESKAKTNVNNAIKRFNEKYDNTSILKNFEFGLAIVDNNFGLGFTYKF